MANFNQEYQLPPVNRSTQERINEIKFYYMFKNLYDLLEESGKYEDAINIVQSYARIVDADAMIMTLVFGEMRKHYAKPTKKDTVLALRFLGLSYVDIQKYFGIHALTVSKYVKQFIEDEQPSLRPLLSPNWQEDLDKALGLLEGHFMPFGRICGVFYDAELVRKRNSK